MNDILALFPMFFFVVSIFFRFRENAVNLYQDYNLPIREHYTWTIPLKDMRSQMESTDNQALRADLRCSIKNRMLLFLFAILAFLSMIVVGSLP